MAVVFDANYGSASSVVNASTVGMSPTAQINTGRKLIVCFWTRLNAPTLSGVADNSTQGGAANVYTSAVVTQTPDVNGMSGILWCDVTRNILTTDTITVTFGGGGGTQNKVIGAMAFTGCASGGADTTARAAATAATADSGSTATTSLGDAVTIGCISVNSAVAQTVGNDGQTHTMNAVHNSNGGAFSWLSEYFIETATAAYKATSTFTSNPYKAQCAVFIGIAASTGRARPLIAGQAVQRGSFRHHEEPWERSRHGVFIPDSRIAVPELVM